MYHNKSYVFHFFYLGFLARAFTNHGNAGEEEGHFLNREPLVSERKSLTTKLRALLMLLAVNELGNPFLDDSGDLYALDTKEVANQNAVKTLRQVQDIGVKQFEEYLEARLWTQVTLIADTISKINICVFTKMKSRQTTKKDEEPKGAKTM